MTSTELAQYNAGILPLDVRAFFTRVVAQATTNKALVAAAAVSSDEFNWTLRLELPRLMRQILDSDARLTIGMMDNDSEILAAVSVIARELWTEARA